VNRRSVLTAVGAATGALAGCAGVTGSDPAATETASSECSVPDGRAVTLETTGSLEHDLPLSLSAEVTRAAVTGDAPPRLSVTLANEGEDPVGLDVAEAATCHLFDREHGGSDPTGLWLHYAPAAPATADSGCWRESESALPRTYAGAGCPEETLAAGSTIELPYEVWADVEADSYYGVGTYGFEASFTARPGIDTTSGTAGDALYHVSWSLTLRVDRPA